MKSEVRFVNESLKDAFNKLSNGSFEEKQLKKFIERAFKDIMENSFCGIQIPKKLIPLDYIKHYNIKNLWKYDLPRGWRLVYSIEKEEIQVISIILEWFDHKSYERRFKY